MDLYCHTTLKRLGINNVKDSLYIDPSHIKQITGRAGRKSSQSDVGRVTTWQEADLAYVKLEYTVYTVRLYLVRKRIMILMTKITIITMQ